MIAYFDTSALIKLLIEEAGSDLAVEAWDGADLRATSRVAYAEARAALASAARDRRLTRHGLGAARSLLDDRWGELYRIDVSERLVRSAGDLAEREGLGGFDALHLASALEATEGRDVLVVAWDTTLARAAVGSGLSVAPPLG